MKKIIYAGILLAAFSFTTLYKQTGKWQVLQTTNSVDGRSECGLAAVNGMLYLIGGDGPAAAVQMLNPVTKTWQQKAMAPVMLHHFQALSINNKIYVLDAFSEGSFPTQTPASNVYIYDTQQDQWQKGGAIPAHRKRAGAGAAVYNGKLYLVAGITHGHTSGTNNMFDVYDPATGTWDSLPNAPHIRDHATAAVIKDKLYAVGGRNTSFRDPENKLNFFSQTVLEVDCYDFKTGQWSTLPYKLPLGTGGGAMVNLNDKLYYMGGERATATEQNAPRKNVYYFDPSVSDGWIAAPGLNEARNGTGACVLNNKIYLAGGSGGGGPRPGGAGGPPPGAGQMPGNPPNGFDPQDTTHRPPPGGGPGGGGKIVVEVFTAN